MTDPKLCANCQHPKSQHVNGRHCLDNYQPNPCNCVRFVASNGTEGK